MNKPKDWAAAWMRCWAATTACAGDAMATLPVGAIRPGKYQPRTAMDEQALNELAASIRAQGSCSRCWCGRCGREQYELIAGERRWRAAQIAGLASVPVLVREVPDEAAPPWR
jgi:ParB family chromosome partitioning protein